MLVIGSICAYLGIGSENGLGGADELGNGLDMKATLEQDKLQIQSTVNSICRKG
jgi:hypothetical protein